VHGTEQGAAAFPTGTELRSEEMRQPEEAVRSEEISSATRCSQCEQHRLYNMGDREDPPRPGPTVQNRRPGPGGSSRPAAPWGCAGRRAPPPRAKGRRQTSPRASQSRPHEAQRAARGALPRGFRWLCPRVGGVPARPPVALADRHGERPGVRALLLCLVGEGGAPRGSPRLRRLA